MCVLVTLMLVLGAVIVFETVRRWYGLLANGEVRAEAWPSKSRFDAACYRPGGVLKSLLNCVVS